jgi:uncharacterized protein (DUF427 family)
MSLKGNVARTSELARTVGRNTVSARPSSAHDRDEHDGQVIAESHRAVELHETGIPVRYYLPREDVAVDLEASETTSHCPFKGDASYFSAAGVKDAFWVYEDPNTDDAQPVRGHRAAHDAEAAERHPLVVSCQIRHLRASRSEACLRDGGCQTPSAGAPLRSGGCGRARRSRRRSRRAASGGGAP